MVFSAIFVFLLGAAHKAIPISEDVKHDLENRLNGGQGQNKIGGAHLHHVDISIHAWKVIAFAGCCTQSGTPQWRLMKKIHVKHDFGNRLNGCQGQNKIGGAHLHHVGIEIHAW